MTFLRRVSIVAASLAFAGCAAGPTVSQLRNDVTTATLVQHGTEPLTYKFGVVDGASFWAKAAESNTTVYVPLSAGTVAAANVAANAAAAHGRAVVAERAPTVAEIMSGLFNRHPLVNDAGKALLPKLAHAWGVPFNARSVRVLPKETKLEDESGKFTAFQPTTDIVLVFAVSEVEITEKPTLGGALAAGLTVGFNAKQVSSQTTAALTAYKRDAGSGQYGRVWSLRCLVPILGMDVTFPFADLVKSPEKAKQLWDSTTPKLIENCSHLLEASAKQAGG